jgi:hypothetical protein
MGAVRVPGPVTRLARRHGLTRSPLRRSADRVEAAVTAMTVVLALLESYHRAQTSVIRGVLSTPFAWPPRYCSATG